jgi:hypothetical protein
MSAHFRPGEAVVLRYITRIDGVPGMTWPYRVVQDDDDVLALWLPRGSKGMLWRNSPGQPRELVEGDWRRDTLRLMFPGLAYSIWLFWEGDEHRFTTYYVNFEEPFRRTPVGFDTNDHALDIMVAPDLSWQWKDLEEFEGLITSGHFSPEFGATVRATANEVLARVETKDAPFDGCWLDWHAPEGWEPPVLNARWRDEPATLWERRTWAYPLAKPVR